MRFQTIKALFAVTLALMSAPAFAQATAPEPAPLLGARALIPQLQRGELIVVMRHQRTAISGVWDDFSAPWAECTAQRNLSVAGYAAAAQTGQAFRTLEIPIGGVLSSPLCRAMATSRLVFDQAEPREELGHVNEVHSRTEEMVSRDLTAIVAALEPQGRNEIVVTHGINIRAAFGQPVKAGGMLFFERVSGEAVLIGRASATDFDIYASIHLARQQSAADD